MKKVILLSFSWLLSGLINAQIPSMGGGQQKKIYDGRISGIVIDKQTNSPVEIANVALYKANSEKPLDGTITDQKGVFKLKDIKPGWYKLKVSFLGFAPRVIDSIQISERKYNVDLGKIIIEPNSQLLGEAVVEAEAPLIETKIDKLVYNADKDISTKGGNASDVLRKVPMVTVDLEGNVSLQGTQSIKVLINNKPSSVMASSVAEAMKMIPADEIEKVEVITSPSAKYDAEGTGGIINIITKKKNIEGVSGSVYAGAGTRSSNLFSNLNLRSGRYGTGFSLGGFGYRGTGKLETTRISDYSVLTQNGTNKNLGYGPFIQWTNDYDINSKNNISSSVRLRNFWNESEGKTYNSFSVAGLPIASGYNNTFDSKTDGWNYDASIDYLKKFVKQDQEFSASAQITNNNRNTDYYISRIYDSEFIEPYYEKSLNKSSNREVTFQTDYTHPLTKEVVFETGAKSILRNVISDYLYKIKTNGSYIDAADRNNIFDYNQDVVAAYLQGSVNLKNVGFKAGVRFEHTAIKGDFKTGSAASFSNDYSNFIPSSTISYRKAGKYSLKLSYTQRIQRPGMYYLNPYVNNSDATSISYGNPYLNPEKSHSFELGHSLFRKFGSINSSVYHRFTNNSIESYRFIDSNDVYVTTYDNIGRNYSTGISVGSNMMINKLIIGANLNGWYYRVKGTTSGSQYNDGINYSINAYISYKFSEKWGVQAFGFFNGPEISLQGKSTSFFYYNLSARYILKNDKGGIGLGLDNFATPYVWFRNEYKGADFSYKNSNKVNFIGIRLSFDYRFGKMNFSAPAKRRIKNDDLKDGGDENGQGQGQMGK